jgi:hypothetical protein
LGGTPEALKKAYDENANYQHASLPIEEQVIHQFHDHDAYLQHMGKDEYYHDFVQFYASELESLGLNETLDRYLFADTEIAHDLFGRLYAGLLHPLIHLGFGLEFDQPAIVAEALAEAAVHENWVSPLLIAAEEASKAYSGPEKTLIEIMEEIKKDESIHATVEWDDDSKTRDGIMKRGMHSVPKIIGQWTVREDQLKEKTAEMISTVCKFLIQSLK